MLQLLSYRLMPGRALRKLRGCKKSNERKIFPARRAIPTQEQDLKRKLSEINKQNLFLLLFSLYLTVFSSVSPGEEFKSNLVPLPHPTSDLEVLKYQWQLSKKVHY